MSLLDDVSIVVTPNGYKAGELYAVVPVPTEGAEKILNTDFATDSNWYPLGGWSISGGSANCNGGSIMYTNASIIATKIYKITYTVSGFVSGGVKVRINGSPDVDGLTRTSNGTFTEYITSSSSPNGNFSFAAVVSFVGSVDNVSVKEYTSADMDVTRGTAATRVDENGLVNYAEIIGGELVKDGSFPTGTPEWTYSTPPWTISGGSANCDGTVSFSPINQLNLLTIGKQYKMLVDVSLTSGQLRIQEGSTILQTYTVVGSNTVEYYFTATGTSISFKTASTAFVGSIDNVSVKEVTRDNVPRIDYTGGGCPHILAEPQRTNLVTYSEVYGSGTFFSGTSGSVIDNTTSISPSGDANATQVTSTGAGKIQSGGLGLTINTDYTLSFYAKNVDATAVTSRVLATGGSGGSNLTSVSYISELSTTEWTKITHSFNTGTNTTIYVYISNVLNSGGTIQLWGAQLELGSYATSYIPTSGSTVTRNQDIFTRDGIGSLINSTEGVLFVEIAALGLGASASLGLNDGSGANRVLILLQTNGDIRGFVSSNGVIVFDEIYSGISNLNNNKIAVSYKLNQFTLWINGLKRFTDTLGNAPIGLNQLDFDNGSGASIFFGKVKQLQVYDTALTDDQLAALTS